MNEDADHVGNIDNLPLLSMLLILAVAAVLLAATSVFMWIPAVRRYFEMPNRLGDDIWTRS